MVIIMIKKEDVYNTTATTTTTTPAPAATTTNNKLSFDFLEIIISFYCASASFKCKKKVYPDLSRSLTCRCE